MRKFLGTLSAFALLISAGAATAQQQQQQQPAAQQGQGQQTQQGQQQRQGMQAEATVATVDRTNLTLTTEEGDEYVLAQGNLLESLQAGTKVRITYQEQDGQKRVTHLEPVQQ